MNSQTLKNELIFQYAAGTASLSKSLMAASYLFLNSKDKSTYNFFESFCGEELKNSQIIKPSKLSANDCLTENKQKSHQDQIIQKNPLNKFFKSYNDLQWKKVFKGFYEYSINLSTKESAKLIKMDPNAKVPLHSHNGKEFILVLEGSFCDEYGKYEKGDLQINDSKIKHTPIACKVEGCICLTITEQELVFFGPFAPILNIFTVIKSLFNSK